MGLVIDKESARQPDVVRLLEKVDAERSGLYPPESRHLLGIDDLELPSVRFFAARRGAQLVGTGALRVDPEGYGEVKRMYVVPEARGQGIGRMILERLEQEARDEGLSCLRLETGVYQDAAMGLYERAGFRRSGAFAHYSPDDPLLVFMEKEL